MNCNSENLARIHKSLLWVSKKPDGIVVNYSDDVENLLVIKEGDIVSLHFMDTKMLLIKTKISDSMSSIDISNPLNLQGKYAQAMMLGLVFKPQPKRLYMLGFGGGRIPMVYHHYVPKLVIEASEHSEGVVQLAEACFGITIDERMRIGTDDGRDHLNSFPDDHFDIILLDSFSGVGEHPSQLSTKEFYQLCKSRLTQDGIVVTNLVDNNPYFKQKVATFCASFKYSYQYESEGVFIFYGSNVDNFNQTEFRQSAKGVMAQYAFTFPFIESSECVTSCHTAMYSEELLHDNDIYEQDVEQSIGTLV